MPPRKTDATSRGDVSMAQFVYDGDESDLAAPAAPSQPAPVTTNTAFAPISAPAPPTQTDANDADDADESSLAADKDKDREKKEHVTIEDLTLPKSIITRLAKGVLPPNTQIQGNAILAMSKSATVFISHLANAANEHTLDNNKKTIMPGDVFAALEDIEFPFLRERLEAEFKKFNEIQTTKRNTYRRRVAAAKKAEKTGAHSANPDASILSTTSGISEAPRSKKQKPNAAHEDSAMDVDEGDTLEPQDASDADTEPDAEQEEDEEEDEEEEEEENDENEEEEHDRLEEREEDPDDDDALDNGGESD
ncbi:histone-fold-containing protein [Xylariaceae sp. FL1019]|nr:histone-fold-containing protein [Xylariaceae sp. FL1019]